MTETPVNPYAAGPPEGLSPQEVHTWSGAAHWSVFIASLVGMAFLGPLLVLLIKGNQSQQVRAHAAESLNFQLSLLVYSIVGTIVAVVVGVLTFGIGLLLLIPVYLAAVIFWFVCTLLGAIRASEGNFYHYPLTMRMIS